MSDFHPAFMFMFIRRHLPTNEPLPEAAGAALETDRQRHAQQARRLCPNPFISHMYALVRAHVIL